VQNHSCPVRISTVTHEFQGTFMLRSLVIVGCLVTMLVPASAQQTFDDIRRQM